MPVEEPVTLYLEAPGYESRRLNLQIPDGEGPYMPDELAELTRSATTERLIVVKTTPETAQLTVDGKPQSLRTISLSTATEHTFRAQAEGFLETSQTLRVAAGDQPLTVALDLTPDQTHRKVRPRTHPRAVVTLRPHGRPDQTRTLHDGEEFEYAVGARLIACVMLDGALMLRDHDVTVERGEGVQELNLTTPDPGRVPILDSPYALRFQPGGTFRSGFDPVEYGAILKEKRITRAGIASLLDPAGDHAPKPSSLSAAAASLQAGNLDSGLFDQARIHGAQKIWENRQQFRASRRTPRRPRDRPVPLPRLGSARDLGSLDGRHGRHGPAGRGEPRSRVPPGPPG